MFLTLDDAFYEIQVPVAREHIDAMMSSNGLDEVVLEEDDGIYEKGDKFKSFHRQANQPISRKALLAGILSVWLKKCVLPSLLHDGILPLVLFSAVHWLTDDPQIASSDGLMHPTQSPGIDRCILQADDQEEGGKGANSSL